MSMLTFVNDVSYNCCLKVFINKNHFIKNLIDELQGKFSNFLYLNQNLVTSNMTPLVTSLYVGSPIC